MEIIVPKGVPNIFIHTEDIEMQVHFHKYTGDRDIRHVVKLNENFILHALMRAVFQNLFHCLLNRSCLDLIHYINQIIKIEIIEVNQ